MVHGIVKAKVVVFLSDGADWLRHLHKDIFSYSVRILDWYHAVKHLWDTGRELFGDNLEVLQQWVEPLKTLLYDGQIETVLEKLLIQSKNSRGKISTALINLYNYYHKNKDAMRYKEFREKGYFIGSGAIESANKYVVTSRLKLTGCRWDIKNGSSIIWLRAKYFEDNWEYFWEKMNFRDFCEGQLDIKLIA